MAMSQIILVGLLFPNIHVLVYHIPSIIFFIMCAWTFSSTVFKLIAVVVFIIPYISERIRNFSNREFLMERRIIGNNNRNKLYQSTWNEIKRVIQFTIVNIASKNIFFISLSLKVFEYIHLQYTIFNPKL